MASVSPAVEKKSIGLAFHVGIGAYRKTRDINEGIKASHAKFKELMSLPEYQYTLHCHKLTAYFIGYHVNFDDSKKEWIEPDFSVGDKPIDGMYVDDKGKYHTVDDTTRLAFAPITEYRKCSAVLW